MLASLLAALFLLAIAAVIAVPFALIRGYVLSILWGWFFVPLGVPVIHIVGAIGIALTVGFLFEQHPNPDKKTEHPLRDIIVAFITPFVALGIGYFVHCYQ